MRIACAALALTLIPVAAAAQAPQCYPRAQLLAHLAGKYQEAPAARGVADNGVLVELLVSPDGRTWTMLVTLPSGTSCFLATGTDWQAVSDPGQPS